MTVETPDQALVRAAMEQVWESMLYAVAEPWAPGDHPDFRNGLQAQIALTGEWNGELRLTLDGTVAAEIAGAMLGADEDEELPELDVHDAVGEVLNVVGGSVKGALGGATALGLPGVTPVTVAPDHDDCVVVAWRGSPVYVQVVPAAG
ncbi:chemotaxis protein CheX [Nocardioides ferulae]|uniref:chemotaxis protein CheX n=1 Tax=Nocardioides ferulae TaxID=2340821 RepID=UPI000EB49DA9|nr:chemotaxis protein CheX [Nocardioides ferulae]